MDSRNTLGVGYNLINDPSAVSARLAGAASQRFTTAPGEASP
ncbi:hypothetical protein [Pseudomonas typographi]|nr:hypothetical protein [Pseudomonas typographi]